MGAKIRIIVELTKFCTMKVADLVKFSGEMLKRLHETGISMDDYQWLQLYEEYERMKKEGNKTTWVVADLSRRFGICERKVYKVVRRFATDCRIGAA
jgi:hypothetical protein